MRSVGVFVLNTFYNPLLFWFQEAALFASVKLSAEMNCFYVEGCKCFHYALSIIWKNAF